MVSGQKLKFENQEINVSGEELKMEYQEFNESGQELKFEFLKKYCQWSGINI